MTISPPWRRSDRRTAAVVSASMTGWSSASRVLKLSTVPARPRRSSARRISGAKMTGMAMSSAGRVLRSSQEKARSSQEGGQQDGGTTRKMMPRSSTTACVPRTRASRPNMTTATSRMSRRLSQSRREKIKATSSGIQHAPRNQYSPGAAQGVAGAFHRWLAELAQQLFDRRPRPLAGGSGWSEWFGGLRGLAGLELKLAEPVVLGDGLAFRPVSWYSRASRATSPISFPLSFQPFRPAG